MSAIATAIVGSAVVGYAASNKSSSRAEAAANRSTDAAARSAELQYDLGKETLEFQKDYYNNTLKPMQERDLKLREDLNAELLPALRQQRDQSKEQYDYYKENYQPIEKRVAEDALGYDSMENIGRRSGIAAASVNQQFSNAQQQGARSLSRYGINPNSSAFARENAKLSTNQALASAGAQTGAALDTIDKAIALRAGAANFGRNMPNSSATFGQVANQTAGTASGVSSGGVSNAVSAVGPMNAGFGLAINANNSGAGIMNDSFRNNMAMFNAQQAGTAGLFQGIGSFAGSRVGQDAFGRVGANISNWWSGLGSSNGFMNDAGGMEVARSLGFANGGEIEGPGGPRDDRVPALLSDGEFVLNEGAVKHFGLAKLNKMNEVGLKNQEARGLIRRS